MNIIYLTVRSFKLKPAEKRSWVCFRIRPSSLEYKEADLKILRLKSPPFRKKKTLSWSRTLQGAAT